MGDPGGIGPEICIKTLDNIKIYEECRPFIIGDSRIVADAIRFCGLALKINSIQTPTAGSFNTGTIDVLDLENFPLAFLKHKQITAEQGKVSFEYVKKGIELALKDEIDAVVTGPINKYAVHAAGYHYTGHTEIFADLTNTKDYAMMLFAGDFRVAHVSTHVSLLEACKRVKKDRVKKVIELVNETLIKLGIMNPRIGVSGLNPHCGEGGLFGTEDENEIKPAINETRAEGIDSEGPIPADTIFIKMRGGMYDAVVAMYHDQGHIPTKQIGFHYDDGTGTWDKMKGVNVTLGLPIIRTSVDHGTAFGKAGEGRANPQSMIEAVTLAAVLAGSQ